PHLGCQSAIAQFIAGERSWFEAYTETRALNLGYRSRSDASRPLVLSGYDAVSLPDYRDYWINGGGSGIAQFSSRNFFSTKSNLGSRCGGLPLPRCDPQAYVSENVDFLIPTLTGESLRGRVRFYLNDITDPRTGQ